MTKITLIISLLILVSSIAQAAMTPIDESNNKINYEVEVILKEGWNLVPAMCNSGVDDIQSVHIRTLFFYNQFTGEEFNYYHEGKFQNEKELASQEEYLCSSSWWALATADSAAKYKTDYIQKIEDRELRQGWNFIILTPEYEGKTFNEMKGNCAFDKIYNFVTVAQDWFDLTDDNSLDQIVDPSNFGSGVLIKVSDICSMGTTTVTPPIGEGSESGCTDSDNGKDYFIKGTITGPGPTGDTQTRIDECLDDTSVGEWYCHPSDGRVEGEPYLCPNGCVDGACIR